MSEVKELIEGIKVLCSKADDISRSQSKIDYKLYLEIEVSRAYLEGRLNNISRKVEKAA